MARRWGQAKFIDHGAISSGVLNATYVGATGSLTAWDTVLQTTPEVSKLLMDRMERDFSNLAPQLRKSYTQKDLESQMKTINVTDLVVAVVGPDLCLKEYALHQSAVQHRSLSGKSSQKLLCIRSRARTVSYESSRRLLQSGEAKFAQDVSCH